LIAEAFQHDAESFLAKVLCLLRISGFPFEEIERGFVIPFIQYCFRPLVPLMYCCREQCRCLITRV
jgi:hypothetical protein